MFFLKSKSKDKEKRLTAAQLVEEEHLDDCSEYSEEKFENDDVMLYIAKDISKQHHDNELKRKEELNKKLQESEALRRCGKTELKPSPSRSNTTSANNSDLEQALALSLLESSHHRSSPIDYVLSTDSHNDIGKASPNTASSRDAEEIKDPAVLAFMERRRQRQLQQREEAFTKQMVQEAARLKLNPAEVLSAESISLRTQSPHNARPHSPSPHTMMSIPTMRTTSQDPAGDVIRRDVGLAAAPRERPLSGSYRAKSHEVPAPFRERDTGTPTMSVEAYHSNLSYSFEIQDNTPRVRPPLPSPAASRTLLSYSVSDDVVGVATAPVPPIRPVSFSTSRDSFSHDSSHISHRDNAVAVGLTQSLLQFARQRVDALPQYSGVSRDVAALQLASQWINQASLSMLTNNTPSTASGAVSNGGLRRVRSEEHHEKPAVVVTEWSCGLCTLLNPLTAKKCNACGSPRLS